MVSGGAGFKSLSNCKMYVPSSKPSHLSQGEQKERETPDFTKLSFLTSLFLKFGLMGPPTKPQELAVKKFSHFLKSKQTEAQNIEKQNNNYSMNSNGSKETTNEIKNGSIMNE